MGRPELHARGLSLIHPIDLRPLELTSQPPPDFQSLVRRLRQGDSDG